MWEDVKARVDAEGGMPRAVLHRIDSSAISVYVMAVYSDGVAVYREADLQGDPAFIPWTAIGQLKFSS